jgi:CheY-like chemotaxis protein
MALILIIEDNLEIRENTSELLELEGHEVLVAENGRIGLEIALNNQPNIILCDVMMPEVNGYQVLTELKKNAATAQIPFIFLSAKAEKTDHKIGLDLGASEYIPKPFEVDHLIATIERYLL